MERDEYRRMAAAETRHWWYAATRALLAQILRPHLHPGLRVLDAGCGTGAAGGWLGEVATLVGIDAEPLALGLYRETRPAARLVAASVEHLPLAAASVDLALCVTVLYHEAVADPARALAELARVVRPGGIVCSMEPGMAGLRRAHDRVTRTARRFSPASLRDLLLRAGFEPLRVTGAYAFLVPAAAAKALLEHGRTASDLDAGRGGLAGVLPALARLERCWLERHDLPAGLSVVGVGRRPG